MSSSTEESVDEQVSPPEVKQTVVERHPAWEEVDNGLISTPKSNDQAKTSQNELHLTRHRDAWLMKLAAWKPILLFIFLPIIIASLYSTTYFISHSRQMRKNVLRLEKLKAQIDSLTCNIMIDETSYINWFNFHHGARAIPSLSSPHHMNPAYEWWWPPLRSPFRPPKKISFEQELLDQEKLTNPDGPNAPLVLMREEYDVPPYCVASGAGDEYGKLELAINTPRPIVPIELTIEHYPETEIEEVGVKSRAVAPKEFELWVYIINPSTHAAAQQNITKLYPTIMTTADPPSQRYREPDSAQVVDPGGWVPIGRWEFAMLSSPYKKAPSQKFRPQVNVEEVGFVTDMFLLRVNTNWGDPRNTCLVRVRMRGLDRSATFEYLERDDGDL